MRNSQAKHVYVYGWGGAREGGCTKDLSQEKGIIWGGGQKSFHVVCTLCVCVCEREREREREKKPQHATNTKLFVGKESSLISSNRQPFLPFHASGLLLAFWLPFSISPTQTLFLSG